MVVDACDSSYLGGGGRRMESSRPAWIKVVGPYLINKMQTKGKRAGGMAQVVETLGSIPSIAKKNQKTPERSVFLSS
jgi:hypothetical protein